LLLLERKSAARLVQSEASRNVCRCSDQNIRLCMCIYSCVFHVCFIHSCTQLCMLVRTNLFKGITGNH
jgi:hypothetical protein